MPKRPKYDPVDDEPKVGDVWKLVLFDYEIKKDQWTFYLLTESNPDDERYSFTALCLNTGETDYLYFNFELDDWRLHA